MYSLKNQLNLLHVFADMICLNCAYFIGIYLTSSNVPNPIDNNKYLLLIILIFVWILISEFTRLYNKLYSRTYFFEIKAIIKNVLYISIFTSLILLLFRDLKLTEIFILVFINTTIFLVSIEHLLFRSILNLLSKKRQNRSRILIVGAGKTGWSFYKAHIMNDNFGYNFIGFLDDSKHPYLNGNYLGPVSKLDDILKSNLIDNVIITLPNSAGKIIENVLEVCDRYPTRVSIIPDYSNFISDYYTVNLLGKFPVISVRNDKLNESQWLWFKRIFDILFSISLFIFLFSWTFPIIMLLQKIFNPGTIFYKAKRWGRNGKEFICYKFRSMNTISSPNDTKTSFKPYSLQDKTTTPFGRFLRKSSIDELPQFINVLKGEMSTVGPRPYDSMENIEIKNKIKSYMWRYVTKPGITGWAQVHGYRGKTTNLSLMIKRTEFDIWYIENWSTWLDIKIIVKTIFNMLKGDPNAQ